MFNSSHLTTTIFCPLRICLEMIEAKRPNKWPLPSITTTGSNDEMVMYVCVDDIVEKVKKLEEEKKFCKVRMMVRI